MKSSDQVLLSHEVHMLSKLLTLCCSNNFACKYIDWSLNVEINAETPKHLKIRFMHAYKFLITKLIRYNYYMQVHTHIICYLILL